MQYPQSQSKYHVLLPILGDITTFFATAIDRMTSYKIKQTKNKNKKQRQKQTNKQTKTHYPFVTSFNGT